MGFSLVSLIHILIRRSFTSAGLVSHTVSLDDGDTTLHCWLSRSLLPSPPNPNPNPNPPLLLIHGFGPDSTWQWRSQIRPLSRHFPLIIPDLLFFGGSTTRLPDRSDHFQAACAARLLDALGVSAAAAVVGTSYGGFVAYHVARALGPDRVGRVVIASSDMTRGDADDAALRERAGVESVSDLMLPRTPANFRKLIGLSVHRRPPPGFMPDFLIRDVMRNLYKENFKEKLELLKDLTIGDKDKFQITPLPQEVLIVWGEYDQIFPLEKAYELKKQLGESTELEILKNTSHVPQVEDPDQFNKVVLKFLLGSSRSCS